MTERSAALGIGTLAAIVSAAPAVPRVASGGSSAALGFLALAGGTALVLGPALFFASGARADARGFRAALLGLALAAAPLSLLAEGLSRGTHHRPLGAATFAVLALAAIAGTMVVAWRVLGFSASGSKATNRVVFALTALIAVGSIGFVLVRSLAAPALVPHVLDGLRALATATLCHLMLRLPRVTRVAGRAGGPLWAAVVVAGLVVMRGVPAGAGARTAEVVRTAAPVLGGPLAWL